MILKELLSGVQVLETAVPMDTKIADVAYDSRKVMPGGLFVAISGFTQDGNRFLPAALEAGAAAVVTAHRPEGAVPYVLVKNDRLALAQISANFYGHPAEKMTMVGITGTNGKTTTTLLLKHILETALDAKVGLIGTMGSRIGAEEVPSQRTTPESLELQALLSQMERAKCQYVVMEVSSHALALNRVGGVQYEAAAFTNLTEDHLDFHKTMESYCDAKARLFGRCRRCVMNGDDPWYLRMAAQAAGPVLTVGMGEDNGLRAQDVELRSDGVRFTAVLGEDRSLVSLPIPGRFSVYNALTALGLAVELGVPLAEAAQALATAPGVKGRVEVVPTPGKPYTVLIDYAHTPDGLENVLRSVRDFCRGRLIVVFGCGGDRDPMKRPIMGEIGTRLADYAIITSDNPRSEEPMDIIRDILAGVKADDYEVVSDRRAAIRRALELAEQDDLVVLAGKGHETYQEIQGVKLPLDERVEVAAYLAESR